LVAAGGLPKLIQALATELEMEPESMPISGFIERFTGAMIERGANEVAEFGADDGVILHVFALGIGRFKAGGDAFDEGEEQGGAGQDGFIASADARVGVFEELFRGKAGAEFHGWFMFSRRGDGR
jgi:hypothetical protein